MVNIMMGPEGSGKTKLLIGALNQAVQRESGSIVCIEKGDTLRFDVDHKVRLSRITHTAVIRSCAALSAACTRETLISRIFLSTTFTSCRRTATPRKPRISLTGAASSPQKTASRLR